MTDALRPRRPDESADDYYNEIVEVVVHGARVKLGRLEAIVFSRGWPLLDRPEGA